MNKFPQHEQQLRHSSQSAVDAQMTSANYTPQQQAYFKIAQRSMQRTQARFPSLQVNNQKLYGGYVVAAPSETIGNQLSSSTTTLAEPFRGSFAFSTPPNQQHSYQFNTMTAITPVSSPGGAATATNHQSAAAAADTNNLAASLSNDFQASNRSIVQSSSSFLQRPQHFAMASNRMSAVDHHHRHQHNRSSYMSSDVCDYEQQHQQQSAAWTAGDKLSRTNIYIRGLPREFDDQELGRLCQGVGRIRSLKAILDKDTNRCKGYGFVDFESADAAYTAMKRINSTTTFHAQMAKQQEQDPTNLYFANLSPNVTENVLETILSQYGNVISTRILRDNSARSKGVGFARMESKDICERIIGDMNGKFNNNLGGKEILIKFADGSKKPKQPHRTSFTCGSGPAVVVEQAGIIPGYNPILNSHAPSYDNQQTAALFGFRANNQMTASPMFTNTSLASGNHHHQQQHHHHHHAQDFMAANHSAAPFCYYPNPNALNQALANFHIGSPLAAASNPFVPANPYFNPLQLFQAVASSPPSPPNYMAAAVNMMAAAAQANALNPMIEDFNRQQHSYGEDTFHTAAYESSTDDGQSSIGSSNNRYDEYGEQVSPDTIVTLTETTTTAAAAAAMNGDGTDRKVETTTSVKARMP